MPTLDALKTNTQAAIRRALDGSFFLQDHGGTLLAALTSGASAELVDLAAAGFKCPGYILEGGEPVFKSEVNNSPLRSWGSLEPTRQDILSDVMSTSFTLQETNALTLALAMNIVTAGVKGDATTGEVHLDKPLAPSIKYHQALFVAKDGAPGAEYYVGALFPKAAVTTRGEWSWNPQSAMQYPLTLTAFVDEDAGFAARIILAGKGFKDNITDYGFALATP